MKLVVEGLRYRYPSGFEAGPLDLEVERGAIHLQGPNGSGKSTLLRCLCGALRRSTGGLSLDGRDPRHDDEVRQHIAYLPAEPELPDVLTVDEAWQHVAALRRQPNWDGTPLRERFGLPGALPLGQCSAGQRQLAELIVALAGDPAVLLLDEPFANLDADRAQRLADWLSERARAHVVVLTSHQPPPLPIDRTVALA